MYVEGDVPVNVGNGGCNGNGAFGDGWWGIILIALLFGWGRGGYGFGGGYGGGDGVMNNYVLGSDFSMLARQLSDGINSLERKGDSIQNGLCDGFYAQNTNLLNGFSGVQQTLCQGFSGINTAIVQQGYETRLGIGDVKNTVSTCCCDLKSRLADINYNMANNFSAVNYNMAKNTCDIIQAGHNDTQRIVDLLTAQTIEAKNEKIAEQQAMISALQLKASQEAQNAYLINNLKPSPSPAYVVPNPNCCYNSCGCGCTSAQ